MEVNKMSFFQKLTNFFRMEKMGEKKFLHPKFVLPEHLKNPKTSEEYNSTIGFVSQAAVKHEQVASELEEIVSKIVSERIRTTTAFKKQNNISTQIDKIENEIKKLNEKLSKAVETNNLELQKQLEKQLSIKENERLSLYKKRDEIVFEGLNVSNFLKDLKNLRNVLQQKKQAGELSEEVSNTLTEYLNEAIKKTEEHFESTKPLPTEIPTPAYTISPEGKFSLLAENYSKTINFLTDLETDFQQYKNKHSKTREEYSTIKKAFENERAKTTLQK